MTMNEVDVCGNLQSKLLLLNPQDFNLSNCGVPQVPSNARFVDLFTIYTYANVLGAAGSGTDILLDEKKTVDCRADFILHKITPLGPDAPTAATGYYLRIQWPNGRYSSQVLQDVETMEGVCYTKNCHDETVGIRIPAGRDIGIALQNKQNAAQNVTLLFEGVSRFYLCARRVN
jgi:hypothetical protein